MAEMLKKVQRKNVLVNGISRARGFTFLELVVALALIGLMATIVIPNLNRLQPGYERKEFITTLSALTQRAWQSAVTSQRQHRVWFDLLSHRVVIEKAAEKKNEKGEILYQELPHDYVASSYTWKPSLLIKDFFINGTDEMHRPGRVGTINEVWFYIYPDGSTQEVIINVFDTSDTSQAEAGTRFSLVLSPFTGTFSIYDTFQQS